MNATAHTLFTRFADLLSRPWAALLWLAAVLLCASWIAISLSRGYQFDTSVLALLPKAEHRDPEQAGALAALNEALLARADQQLASLASGRMLFLVSAAERQQGLAAAKIFAETLRDSGLFAELTATLGQSQVENAERTFFPYRYQLMTSAARAALTEHPIDQNHPLLQQALARLYSPMASAVAPMLVDDPLQLFFAWQLDAAPRTSFAPEGGWLTRNHEGHSYRLLAVTLAGDPYELDYQQRVAEVLADAESRSGPDSEVLSSGLLLHAAYGAGQARQEISTIGLGSLLGIALLLLWCFRRPRYLALAFLPIVCGWLFALAICMLVFPALHLITLAFGASLIGVAVDYSLHFICANQSVCAREGFNAHEGGGSSGLDQSRRVLRLIMPGMLLGLISSALAYAAQGVAPFPGLRQMAVFSVSGLLGAWLTVMLWLPYLSASASADSAQTAPLHRFATRLSRLLAAWPNVSARPVAAALVMLLAAAAWQLGQLQFADDIRRLQTSPAALLEEDAQVQRLTGAASPGQYFVISADDQEQLLQAEEKLAGSLEDLLAAGALADYQAISRWVPSAVVQTRNRELNREVVYAQHGLAGRLAETLGSPQLTAQMQTRFLAQSGTPLTVEEWLASDLGRQQGFLWLGEEDERVHSLVLLSGIRDSAALMDLARLAERDQRIQFVDKVAGITDVLKVNREQLMRWIAAAYLIVFLVLALRYRRAAWRILAAPAIASLLCLATLSAGGFTITIFNLLALLLVLGIGLDAGIFLQESGRSPYTWAAVTLAACTTLLAFGLLALSETPVLHQFGLTVLLGIVGVWVLAPCFIRKTAGGEHVVSAAAI
jgi:predicted exporter